MRRVLLAVGVLSLFSIANADWAEFSAASFCDPEAKRFAIESVVRTSGEFNLDAPDQRFIPLSKGISRELECRLGDSEIRMTYTALGPLEQGMCRGIGFTEIRALEFDGMRVLSATELNSGCFHEPTLVSVRLGLLNGRPMAELCHVQGWSWDRGYSAEVCKSQPIEPDNPVVLR